MGYKCQFGCETNNLNSPQPFPSAIPNYLDQEWQSLGAGQSLLTDTWWIWTHLSKEKHSRVIPESHVAVLFLFFSLKMYFRKSCPILFFFKPHHLNLLSLDDGREGTFLNLRMSSSRKRAAGWAHTTTFNHTHCAPARTHMKTNPSLTQSHPLLAWAGK